MNFHPPGAAVTRDRACVAEPFAWQLADRIIALTPSPGDHPPPTGQGALARWLYIAALRDTPPHHIDPTIAPAALGALAASAAGVTRTLQAATALLDDVVGRVLERETGFEPATFCLGSRHSAS